MSENQEHKNKIEKLLPTRAFDRSKILYKKGDVIEAFVVLYSVLEYGLLHNWSKFVYGVSWTRESSIFSDIDVQRKYMEHVQLCYEVGLIDNKEKSIFKKFHDGRNKVVHEMNHFRKGWKFNKKQLNGQFKAGLQAWLIIWRINEKIGIKYYLPRFDHPKLFAKYDKMKIDSKLEKTWKTIVDLKYSSSDS